MAERVRLPNRRVSELVDFEHAGRRWTLTVGRFADGRVGEVFLDTPKASAIGEIAADAAIAASVAFQHGAPLENGAPCACGPPCGPPGCGAGVDRRLSGPT
jgi:ribonucleoside-diphosphate reductase alpha chain